MYSFLITVTSPPQETKRQKPPCMHVLLLGLDRELHNAMFVSPGKYGVAL